MPDLKSEAPQQFGASASITAAHVESITTQSTFMIAGEKSTEELKRNHQALKTEREKAKIEFIDPFPRYSSLGQSIKKQRGQLMA